MNRGFYDRDFIEDDNGLIFAVVGSMHPRDRVISYLKYTPSSRVEKKIWSRSGVWYERVLPYYGARSVLENSCSRLESVAPDYIVYDEVLGTKMIEVPLKHVRKHYKPEYRLKEIFREQRDELEEATVELVDLISEYTGVPKEYFGVTGSILLSIHNPKISDIDLIVYGLSNSFRVREFLKSDSRVEAGVYRLEGEVLKKYALEATRAYPLSIDEAIKLYSKDLWNRGVFKGRFFSIHPVLRDWESPEKYGDRVYRSLGLIEAECRVYSTRYAMFTPSIYLVDEFRVIKSSFKGSLDIREVASYESVYADIARDGEWIRVRGKLELVKDLKKGVEYHRVLIGSFDAGGKDYVKPMHWLENNVF